MSLSAAGLILEGRYRSWIQPRSSTLTREARDPRVPLSFDFRQARQGAARLPILRGTLQRRVIATPRRLQATASAPTRRTLGDFGTSVAFCENFNRGVEPQGSTVEDEFMCLIMGYPEDWADDETAD